MATVDTEIDAGTAFKQTTLGQGMLTDRASKWSKESSQVHTFSHHWKVGTNILQLLQSASSV